MAKILIKGGLLVTMSERYGIIRDGSVCVEGKKITAVGPSRKVVERCPADVVIDARGMAVLPGLINTHSHLYQSLLRGRADTAPLVEWCEEVLYPFCRMLLEDATRGDEELAYYGTLLSCDEALKSGTTTIVGMEGVIQGPAVVRALVDAGIRGVYALTLANEWIRRDIILPTTWSLRRAESLIAGYRGAGDGRVGFMLAPSTPFCCSRDLLEESAGLARRNGAGIHIHVAETKYEVGSIMERFGMGPLEYLNSLGLLDIHPFVAVHCVWLSGPELKLLKEKGAGASHNPESNMKLASGVAPVREMLDLGIPVGLATDGPASNDNLDMIEEMRSAALLHKVSSLDASSISAWDVLRMATILGARALGMEEVVGSLEPGKRADIVMLNLMRPHIQPLTDVVKAIVYCARGSDVDTVMVDGRVVVRGGRLTSLDERELLNGVRRLAEEKLSELEDYRQPRKPVSERDLEALMPS